MTQSGPGDGGDTGVDDEDGRFKIPNRKNKQILKHHQ